MRVCVLGLWHLGCVTAAGLAKAGFQVVGLDESQTTVDRLNQGQAPLHEPGLNELIKEQMEQGQLSFSSAFPDAAGQADVIWCAYDTPVNEQDEADVDFVEQRLQSALAAAQDGVRVIISSQAPVGFTRKMEEWFAASFPGKRACFVAAPENLRLGSALKVFLEPDRIVIGVRDEAQRKLFEPIFSRLSGRLEWMRTESAEMVKHGINSFLAGSIAFANELAAVCELTGADAAEVARGLKTDIRIGPKAYVQAGPAFSGGTLARDLNFLTDIGDRCGRELILFKAVKASNNQHKNWVQEKCTQLLNKQLGAKIAVLGLTYKPNTSTLRRSLAVELCLALSRQGFQVHAFDPVAEPLSGELAKDIMVETRLESALCGAECMIVATEHAQFKDLNVTRLGGMKHQRVIDPSGFLRENFAGKSGVQYLAVGYAAKESE